MDEKKVEAWMKMIGSAIDKFGFLAIIAFMLFARIATGTIFAYAWAKIQKEKEEFVIITWGHNAVEALMPLVKRNFLLNSISFIFVSGYLLFTVSEWTPFLVVCGLQIVAVLISLLAAIKASVTKKIPLSLEGYLNLTPAERQKFGPSGSPASLMMSMIAISCIHSVVIGLTAIAIRNFYGVDFGGHTPLMVWAFFLFVWSMMPVIASLLFCIVFTSNGRHSWKERLALKILQIILAIILPGVTTENMDYMIGIQYSAEVGLMNKYCKIALSTLVGSCIIDFWGILSTEDWWVVLLSVMSFGAVYTMWRWRRLMQLQASLADMVQGKSIAKDQGVDEAIYQTRINELHEENVKLNRESQQQTYATRSLLVVFTCKRVAEYFLVSYKIPFGISLFYPLFLNAKQMIFGGEDKFVDDQRRIVNGVLINHMEDAYNHLLAMHMTRAFGFVVLVLVVGFILNRLLKEMYVLSKLVRFAEFTIIIVLFITFTSKVLHGEEIQISDNPEINAAINRVYDSTDKVETRVLNAVNRVIQRVAPEPNPSTTAPVVPAPRPSAVVVVPTPVPPQPLPRPRSSSRSSRLISHPRNDDLERDMQRIDGLMN